MYEYGDEKSNQNWTGARASMTRPAYNDRLARASVATPTQRRQNCGVKSTSTDSSSSRPSSMPKVQTQVWKSLRPP